MVKLRKEQITCSEGDIHLQPQFGISWGGDGAPSPPGTHALTPGWQSCWSWRAEDTAEEEGPSHTPLPLNILAPKNGLR